MNIGIGRIACLAVPAVLAAPVAAGAQPCSLEKTPVPAAPGSIENQFHGIGGASGDQVWGVGNATHLVAGSRESQTLIGRFDGSAWSIVDSPNPGGSRNFHWLWDVASMPDGSAMAVGNYDPPEILTLAQPLALRWDGSSWIHAEAPEIHGGGDFTSVRVIDGDYWVGGYRVGDEPPPSAFIQAMVARFDGGAWRYEITPPLAMHGQDSYNKIWGIDGASASDVWAVGSAFQQERFTFDPEAFGPLPYIAHYDGSSWRLVEAPAPEPRSTYLHDVEVIASDDVWAVGFYNDFASGSIQPYIIHWDGEGWTMADLPEFPERGADLWSVTARSADEVYAAGAAIDSTGFPRPFMLRFDGAEWAEIPAVTQDGQFRAVRALPTGELWAAGLSNPGSVPLAERLVCDSGCSADCDASGALDFFDFLCFQEQFAAGDPQADCDGSGGLDFFDFLCFQDQFAAGCP